MKLKIPTPFISRKLHEAQLAQLRKEKSEAEKYLLKIIEQHIQMIPARSHEGEDELFDLRLDMRIDPIFLDYAMKTGNPITREQKEKFAGYIAGLFADWLKDKLIKLDFAAIETYEKARSKMSIRYFG